MPITNPAQAAMFNEPYDILGEYVQDGTRVPWYNAEDTYFQPGEPILVKWGAASDAESFLHGPHGVRPGELGVLIRAGDWIADLPCNLSANVALGDELYWDVDNQVVGLVGDVTNGFVVGYAGYAIDSQSKSENTPPPLDANDRIIAGDVNSTVIRVHSAAGPAATKGVVTVY